MKVKDTNTDILNSFLNRTIFYSWSHQLDDNYSILELIINDKCDQACKYCYEIKYGKYYFTEDSKKPENILKNLRILIRWLKEKNYYPRIEIFSAELFSQELGFEVCELLLEELDENFKSVVVPTNMNFIFDDKKIERVEKLIGDFKQKGICFILSASVDGAFMEENRPICSGLQRDEIFYDKLFKFAKKHRIAFHPMVYSNRIEYWKDNWLWFQEKFKQYELPFWGIYLLEVRNVEWSVEQVKEYSKFMKFLIQWTLDFFEGDVDKFTNFILSGKGFNILSAMFITIGRGISCSIQGSLAVRVGDLTIVPCHRTSYEQFLGGQFIVNDNKIVGIKGKHTSTYIYIKSFDNVTQPYCESCYIKFLCGMGCLGSQFEVTGDLFTPIPTVCRLYHVKIVTILKELNRIGCLGEVLNSITNEKRNNVLILMEEFV